MSPPPTITNIRILRIPSASLEQYPRIDDLVALINNAFVTSWNTVDGLVGPDAIRFQSSAQFAQEMGDDGVTWVAFEGSEEEGRIVATAGYKKWERKWKVLERMEAGVVKEVSTVAQEQKVDNEAENEKFELVVVAVDPSLQKTGLAARMCVEVEEELKEKVRSTRKKQLCLMIRTGKENNEAYWTRKGYRVLSEMKFPPGNFGSQTGFSVLDMERVIDL